MKLSTLIVMAGLGLGVSACSAVDVTTRNAPFEALPTSAVSAPAGYTALASVEPTEPSIPHTALPRRVEPKHGTDGLAALPGAPKDLAPYASPVTVNSVVVRVPRSLKVSERNSYLPRGDIVWRGDPIGDRYAQVQKIFEDGLNRGVQSLHGPVKVDLDVQVKRFHALSEKARYTVGGVHSITFDLAIKDPDTGALLVPVREIRADLDGFGGQQALLAEARGETQKVRITAHLAEVIREELSNPKGYKNASLGFYQLLNDL